MITARVYPLNPNSGEALDWPVARLDIEAFLAGLDDDTLRRLALHEYVDLALEPKLHDWARAAAEHDPEIALVYSYVQARVQKSLDEGGDDDLGVEVEPDFDALARWVRANRPEWFA